MQTGFVVTKFRTDARCRHASLAPSLDAKGQAQRRIGQTALDFAQPPTALPAETELNSRLFEGEAARGAFSSEGHSRKYSDHLNIPSRPDFQMVSTYVSGGHSHDLNMAAPTAHDWYLREWFATLGLKQRDLVTKLDYQPALAHSLWHSVQRYRRDHVEEISALLNIQPYELLMPPEEAMALRRLRATIAEVARAERPALPAEDPARTGTEG